jgi:phospholipase A1/A2
MTLSIVPQDRVFADALFMRSACLAVRNFSLNSRLLAALLFFSLAIAQAADSPVLLLSGPNQSVTAGSECAFWLQCLNPSDAPVTNSFPAILRCRWQVGAQGQDGQLTLPADTEAIPMVIPPGGFVRRAYRAVVPAGLWGHTIVSVSVDQLQAAPAVVDVQGQSGGGKDRPVIIGPDGPGAAKSAAISPGTESQLPKAPMEAGEFFRTHFFPYEPTYFVYGPESPNVKFQVSFKYRLAAAEDNATNAPFPSPRDVYFAYSQTSLWDLEKPSAPFFDSSYRPELFYYRPAVLSFTNALGFKLDLQTGFKHESNGRDGGASRSLNIVYLNPAVTLGRPTALNFTLSPRVWAYVGDLSDNPKIANYRGNADLRAILALNRYRLTAWGRAGNTFHHGSFQLDLAVPLTFLKSSLYFQAQYFTGYGESLLRYDQRETQYRFGLGIFP